MLPRNPFNTTYAEMVDSSDAFLTLFDYTAIDMKATDERPLITEDMFDRVVFFSSSPGGGKSSMFHLFSPDVLNSVIQTRGQNIDCYQYLENLGIINSENVRLLGVQLSCARNYEIIEDIYDGAVGRQVFFALLNVRILKETLKNIIALKKGDAGDLYKITFSEIPAELSSVFDVHWTGKDYFHWACEEEKNICISINNMESARPVDFIHNYLSVIQLFEASKILYDGKPLVDKVLFMLDDVHNLTQNQRRSLRDSLFTVRARAGVWLAQRSYALEENELLGCDGNYGREYISKRLEDQREGRTKAFNKTLEAIADRRVRANSFVDINSFRSCISDKIDWVADKESSKKVSSAYDKLFEELQKYMPTLRVNEIACLRDTKYENAISLRAAKVLIARKINNQQMIMDDYFLALSDLEIELLNEDNTIRNIAEYYLCIENSLPFYYGMDTILSLAFNNVYQFLSYCGELFERRLSYQFEAKKRRVTTVLPAEQERIISRVSTKRWDELDVLYSDSERIKTFLENMANIGIRTREIGAASYSGGTYTGIGIRDYLLNKIVKDDEYKDIKTLLATCISGNLLKMRTGKQGAKDEPVTVFYLNRWICVHFRLPLAYGGWRRCDELFLKHICRDKTEEFKNQLY